MGLSPDMSELSKQIMNRMEAQIDKVHKREKIKSLKKSIGDHPHLTCRYTTHPNYSHHNDTLYVQFESGPEMAEICFSAEMLAENDMTVEDIMDGFRQGLGESGMVTEQMREAISETTDTSEMYKIHTQEIEAGDLWDFTHEFYTKDAQKGEDEEPFMTEEEKEESRRAIERGLDQIDSDE
jgi:hypothetical protein